MELYPNQAPTAYQQQAPYQYEDPFAKFKPSNPWKDYNKDLPSSGRSS